MEYCTIQEAAKILHLSRPTVYKLIEKGKLKRFMLLGRPALNLAQVSQMAKKNGKVKK